MTRWTVRGLCVRRPEFTLGPVDLELESGQTVAVIGASGAGKTTLLRALAGLGPAVDGSFAVDGTELLDRPPERRGLVYVPQGLGLFPHRSVLGNVRYPLDLAGGNDSGPFVRSLLDRFGLSPLQHRRISELSTGEQQRVAIARALAARPRLLLWDEPLVSLDVRARDDLLAALRTAQSSEGIPILLVTHDAGVAFSLAQEYLVLDRGRVRYRGGGQALVRAPRSAFVARFLGYENVFAWSEVDRRRASSLGRWLMERTGTGGVCFSSWSVGLATGPERSFPLTVRRVEPVPGGLSVAGEADGFPIEYRSPHGGQGKLPVVGDILPISLDPDGVRPLDSDATREEWTR